MRRPSLVASPRNLRAPTCHPKRDQPCWGVRWVCSAWAGLGPDPTDRRPYSIPERTAAPTSVSWPPDATLRPVGRSHNIALRGGRGCSVPSATPDTPNTAGADRTTRRRPGCSNPDTAPTSRRRSRMSSGAGSRSLSAHIPVRASPLPHGRSGCARGRRVARPGGRAAQLPKRFARTYQTRPAIPYADSLG